MRLVLALSILLMVLSAAAGEGAAFPGTPQAAGTPFDCPVTKPNGNNPPSEPPIPGGFGNDALWTNLAMWSEEPGIVKVPDDAHLRADGWVLDMKWAWWRFEPGDLTIEGRRLDATAPPLFADVPDGYGEMGFQVSGISFPTDGCWEITGRVGNTGSLTFVVLVVYPDGYAPLSAASFPDCPITEPNGVQPPPGSNAFAVGSGDYGNEYLWTALGIWGPDGLVLVPDDERITEDGVIHDMKWSWYRFVEGDLAIEGRRLDAPASPLEAQIFNGSYGVSGFIPSGITFPTDGCWEVTGHVGESGSLTFVVMVVYPRGFVPAAAPIPGS
jgi:hypothetical protein